ncbi:MAG: efflux RND transporter permease subunit [Myxococcota bacterium]
MVASFLHREVRAAVLAVGLVAVAGIASFRAIPRQEDPALSRRFGDIVVTYPGATADRVEALVTEKIENAVQQLHEVDEVESISRTGQSVVFVELEDAYDEEDVDEIWSRLRDELADVARELPEGASEPEFTDRTSTAVTLLVGFTWQQGGPPQLALMSRLAEELENRLRVLPGTKETKRYGEAEEELRVTVDALRLAEIGLDAAEIARAIASADTRRSAGQLRESTSAMPLEIEGSLASVERVRRIPLRADGSGRTLRIGDVARVEKTRTDPPSTVALLGGHRGVAVAATMLPNSGRVDVWSARARGVVEAFRSEVPPGIGYDVLFDQSRYTTERLATLGGNLLLGAGIVVAVLLVMMGARAAFVVATALPLTLAAVIAELHWAGIPLHQTSVTGLILALGLLIDNAIVVVDEYEQRLRRGAGAATAIRQVVGELAGPLAASTLTTVLAFLPIALMPGPGGEFVGPIAIGVALSVVTSLAISLTLILAFAGWTIPGGRGAGSVGAMRVSAGSDAGGGGADGGRAGEPAAQGDDAWWRHGYSDPRLRTRYRRAIVAALRRPALGIGVAIVLPLLGFIVAPSLPSQFFPANDRDQFQVQLDLPAHTPLEATLAAIARARTVIEAHDEVVESHWFAGEVAPRVFYNMIGNYSVPNYAGGFVVTRSPEATARLLPTLQAELLEALPEMLAIALPFEQGPPFDAPIEVRLVGPDLDVLRALGDRVRAVLAETEGVTYTRAKLLGGRPKLVLTANEDAAELAGLRLGDVARQLDAAFEGAHAGRILDGTQDLPIRVRVAGEDRRSIARLASTRLIGGAAAAPPSDGALGGVPIEAVADFALRPELAGIARRNGSRVNTVQAFLVPYQLIQSSLDDFLERFEAAAIELPAGYRVEIGGDFEQKSETQGNLAAMALPLFVLMAGAIVLTFNSFRLATLIFAVAILSVGLALLAVWLSGHPFGFVAIVGTMGLVGVAINDAIVVLNALRLDPRAAGGDPEGTADVVLDATRHVLATTFTTVGGFLPLILFGGRFWPPMAVAIGGGVLGATVVALAFVPTVFAWLRRREAARDVRRVRAPRPVATAHAP